MPTALDRRTMLPAEEILKTALSEHDHDHSNQINEQDIIAKAFSALNDPGNIPFYNPKTTPPLTVCRFRCMLQDTGYPLEVYMPPSPGETQAEGSNGNRAGMNVDWNRLKERWVGWATEVPGEQQWQKAQLEGRSDLTNSLQSLSLGNGDIPPAQSTSKLPESVHGKYPVASKEGDYAGALLKIYDPETTFKPASAHTFIGILSASPLPASDEHDYHEQHDDFEEDDQHTPINGGNSKVQLVPSLHVLEPPFQAYPIYTADIPAEGDVNREEVISYLRSAFGGEDDELAAEFLLLGLVASTMRVKGKTEALGALSVNLVLPKTETENGTAETDSTTYNRLQSTLQSICPLLTPLPLSIPLLSSTSLYPISTPTTSLQSGLLQLPPSSIIVINEDTLANGNLNERGVKNLEVLMKCMREGKLRYEYPFVGEEFGMEVDLGWVVVGQGKSFLPVDVSVPVLSSTSTIPTPVSTQNLQPIRRFIAQARASASTIPASSMLDDEMVEYIQEDYVKIRKESEEGSGRRIGEEVVKGEDLGRWMKIARTLALTYPERKITQTVWEKAKQMDKERLRRLDMS